MIELIALGMVIIGMWGAFYLGSRGNEGELYSSNKKLEPESLDTYDESDEAYEKQIDEWKRNGESTEG